MKSSGGLSVNNVSAKFRSVF